MNQELNGYMSGFLADIDRMNRMYELERVDTDDDVARKGRLIAYENIFREEFEEIWDIYDANDNQLKFLVALADWLGDKMVFIASEAKRWGIPIDRVLHIIMQSNFSKLGADGKPIKDERGKFLKGPNYWKPEEKIEQLLIEWNQK